MNAAGTYGGYISSPTAGTSQNNIPASLSDTSWTFQNTYLNAYGGADPQAFYATQTTFTYSTPYSQNAFVQSQLKAKALQLHQTYSASNYTAWLVATSPTDPSTIAGAKQLTLGDAIVHPAPIIGLAPDGNGGVTFAMPASTDPSWQSSYSVVILPKNIVPIFPGGDITAPTAPTIATSKLTSSSVTLKTSGSTDDVGVVGYNFYRVSTYDYGQGNIQTTIWKANGLVVSAGTTFVDTAVETDMTYIYTARAVDAAGHESLDSPALLVKIPPPDAQPPTAPTITATGSTTTTATLNVFGSTDNVGVDGYDIYRDGLQVNIAPIKVGQSFVDTDLTPGTEYSYSAQAFDAAGNYSEESAAIVVTTTGTTGGGGGEPPGGGGGEQQDPLPVPTIKSSDVTDHSVKLTVSVGADDIRIVSYLIYRDSQPIATLTNGEKSFTDDNLDADVTYHYTVKSLDAAYHASELSRSLAVVTLSAAEAANQHNPNGAVEKKLEELNKWWERGLFALSTTGPAGVAAAFFLEETIGKVLNVVNSVVDLIQVWNAIVHLDVSDMDDESRDLLTDLVGFIPGASLLHGGLSIAGHHWPWEA